jgi:plastocyanin
MEKKQKKWLIISLVIVLVLLIVVLAKKPETFVEEEWIEGFTEQDLKDLDAAPEVKTKEPTEVAPEASKVNEEGVVITDDGQKAITEDVGVGSKDAPKQSKILEEEEKEEVAENAFSMAISRETGFVPNLFKVKPGQAVTLVLTVTDQQKHTLRFKDSSLKAVAITVKDGQSRAITFNAPTRTGVYDFICGDPGHNATGQMIVTNE